MPSISKSIEQALASFSGRKSVSILGATGSVGDSVVDVVSRHPDRFDIVAVTANKNAGKLAEVAKKTGASLAVVADESSYPALKEALSGTGIEVAAGDEAVIDAARRQSDMVLAAIVGAAGMKSTLAAADRGADIALANKESLVCAGDLMMQICRRSGSQVLPVDSEHNAIFQVLDPEQKDSIEKITLTASGGPFRTWDAASIAAATPEQALAHPVWDMGAKISVDSASMMNKGLEVIEAWHLFPVDKNQIDVIVHPQSVIHSMVAYQDGSVLAQLGTPDMRIPVASALSWPERIETAAARLDLAEVSALTFEKPDYDKFPCLRLAREALNAGGAAPTLLNAANEIAVAAFLSGQMRFGDIANCVEAVLTSADHYTISSIGDVLEADRIGRQKATDWLENHTG